MASQPGQSLPVQTPDLIELITTILLNVKTDLGLCTHCRQPHHYLKLTNCGHLFCAICLSIEYGNKACEIYYASLREKNGQGPEFSLLQGLKQLHVLGTSIAARLDVGEKEKGTTNSGIPRQHNSSDALASVEQLTRINADVDRMASKTVPSCAMSPVRRTTSREMSMLSLMCTEMVANDRTPIKQEPPSLMKMQTDRSAIQVAKAATAQPPVTDELFKIRVLVSRKLPAI
jgi:hypothetical protein